MSNHFTAAELLAINPADLIHPECWSENVEPSYEFGVPFAEVKDGAAFNAIRVFALRFTETLKEIVVWRGSRMGTPGQMIAIDLNSTTADTKLRRFYKIQY